MDALKEMKDVSGNHLFMIMLHERIEKLEDKSFNKEELNELKKQVEINNKDIFTLKDELNKLEQQLANIPINNMATNEPFLKLLKIALVLTLSCLFINLIIDVVKMFDS